MPRGATARRSALVLTLALLLIPFGVPRILNHPTSPTTSQTGTNFATACRNHGGTPTPAAAPAHRACLVRYGPRLYRMDAITPNGFDTDAAHFQRQGCTQAQQRTPPTTGKTFIYHPTTGICEHRP